MDPLPEETAVGSRTDAAHMRVTVEWSPESKLRAEVISVHKLEWIAAKGAWYVR
jgi:hypothetical protein